MSRTLSVSMQSHLAGRSHTRCSMLRLDLRDGTSIGITDHDRDLTYNLGDGALTYFADTGILPSDVAFAVGLDADNYEVSGPIGDTVTLTALLGGRLDRARARLFQVNHRNLSHGAIALMAGNVTEARAEGGRFVLEIRNDFDRFNQTVGNIITNYCSGEHPNCCVNMGAETATTVTAVISVLEFTVAATLTDRHVPGRLWFTSGALDGTLPMEIVRRSGDTVELFQPLVEPPQIGDALVVKEGCNRTRTMCRDRFDNVLEFRGYPEVPGSDQIMRQPVPGQG